MRFLRRRAARLTLFVLILLVVQTLAGGWWNYHEAWEQTYALCRPDGKLEPGQHPGLAVLDFTETVHARYGGLIIVCRYQALVPASLVRTNEQRDPALGTALAPEVDKALAELFGKEWLSRSILISGIIQRIGPTEETSPKVGAAFRVPLAVAVCALIAYTVLSLLVWSFVWVIRGPRRTT